MVWLVCLPSFRNSYEVYVLNQSKWIFKIQQGVENSFRLGLWLCINEGRLVLTHLCCVLLCGCSQLLWPSVWPQPASNHHHHRDHCLINECLHASSCFSLTALLQGILLYVRILCSICPSFWPAICNSSYLWLSWLPISFHSPMQCGLSAFPKVIALLPHDSCLAVLCLFCLFIFFSRKMPLAGQLLLLKSFVEVRSYLYSIDFISGPPLMPLFLRIHDRIAHTRASALRNSLLVAIIQGPVLLKQVYVEGIMCQFRSRQRRWNSAPLR